VTALLDERVATAPAFLHVPPRARSLGQQIARLSEAINQPLDAEQILAVDALTSVKADGTPAALEGAVICPRQNLKTFILERITLGKLLEPIGEGERRLVIWSAHLFDTAQESFRNFDELFASHSFLSSRVLKIHRGNGEEEIELHGRRRLKFKARSKSGGRGLSGDTVILDEAFALQPGHMGALLPTLSTRRRAHVLYGSSAGLEESEVLRGVRDRGRAGGPGAPAYVEWCSPGSLTEPGCADHRCRHVAGTDGCTLDDERLWAQSNPALGRRITVDYLRAERQALPPEEFARERLGWWDEPLDAGGVIPMDAWLACADVESSFDGRPVLTLDIALDRSWSCIAAAGYRSDAVPHVEVAAYRSGTDWVVAELARMVREHRPVVVGLDPKGPAGSLLLDLDQAGVQVEQLTLADQTAGCGALYDAVITRDVRHRGDPLLVSALRSAVQRDVGDAWAWGRRRSSGDICPLVAVTEALHLLARHGTRPGSSGPSVYFL